MLKHGGLQERRDVLLETTRVALLAGDSATLRLGLLAEVSVGSEAWDRLRANLERWRWLPRDLDSLAWEDESGFSSKYRLVQRAGPSNPLGRLKLELVNPFAVFLHDTPGSSLFTRADRDLSQATAASEWKISSSSPSRRRRFERLSPRDRADASTCPSLCRCTSSTGRRVSPLMGRFAAAMTFMMSIRACYRHCAGQVGPGTGSMPHCADPDPSHAGQGRVQFRNTGDSHQGATHALVP